MNELVKIESNEPVTTSLIIAEGTENEHRAVLQLIKTHEKDLNEFGTLAFQMRKSGGRPTEYAVLNEMQTNVCFNHAKDSNPDSRNKAKYRTQASNMKNKSP